MCDVIREFDNRKFCSFKTLEEAEDYILGLDRYRPDEFYILDGKDKYVATVGFIRILED